MAVGGVAEDHLAPGRLQRPECQARGSVPGARRGLQGALQEIEQHLVRALTALSLSEPKVFGKFLTETDVKDRFQSCLKTSPRGGSYLKLKMDWGRVRIWGPNQEELAEPGNLAGRECRVRCELRQIWLMSNQCGLLLEVTDLQLKDYEAAGPACPF